MKYKLLKDLPWITAWAEFIEHEDTETFSRIAFSHVPCVWQKFAKDKDENIRNIIQKNPNFTNKNWWSKCWFIFWILWSKACINERDS